MKSKMIVTLFPAMLALFLVAGISTASAADVSLTIGGHRTYRPYVYTTTDPVYTTTWYPGDNNNYVYTNGAYVVVPNTTYTTRYVYTSPSVEFGTWYGDGYRNHSGGQWRDGYGGSRTYTRRR